jgi:hypothetical protein
MRRRFGANEWMLAGCGVVLLLVVGQYVGAALAEQRRVATPPRVQGPYDLSFNEGGQAPNFALPDRDGDLRRLSDLVEDEALLSFVSDDDRCRALLRYVRSLAERRRKAGKSVPAFITVADFDPKRERAFLRETGLDQVVLYEEKEGHIARQYRAEPRPRCFQLSRDRLVSVIGSSPAAASLFQIGEEVLKGWMYRSLAGDFQAPEPAELRRFDASKPEPEGGPAPDRAGS